MDSQFVIQTVVQVITILVSAFAAAYTIVSNTKKYELTEQYRKEILAWYKQTVTLMIRVIHYVESGEFYSEKFSSQKTKMLADLSALIENGRFYFPNVDKKDGFGGDKPSAYQGYRHINLEFLMHFYEFVRDEEHVKIDLLWRLERNFTSVIFDVVEPRKRNRIYSKKLDITFPEDRAMEDFIYQNPENKNVFKM